MINQERRLGAIAEQQWQIRDRRGELGLRRSIIDRVLETLRARFKNG